MWHLSAVQILILPLSLPQHVPVVDPHVAYVLHLFLCHFFSETLSTPLVTSSLPKHFTYPFSAGSLLVMAFTFARIKLPIRFAGGTLFGHAADPVGFLVFFKLSTLILSPSMSRCMQLLLSAFGCTRLLLTPIVSTYRLNLFYKFQQKINVGFIFVLYTSLSSFVLFLFFVYLLLERKYCCWRWFFPLVCCTLSVLHHWLKMM